MARASKQETPETAAGKRPRKSRAHRFVRFAVFVALVAGVTYVAAYYRFIFLPAGEVGPDSPPGLLIVRKGAPSFDGIWLNLKDINNNVARMTPRAFDEGTAVDRDLFPFIFEKLSKAQPGTYPPADYEEQVVAALRKIAEAEGAYMDEYGMYATVAELVSPPDGISLVPPDYASVVFGYRFVVEVNEDGEQFELTGRPLVNDDSLLSFCCGTDGKLRFETGAKAAADSPLYEKKAPDTGAN